MPVNYTIQNVPIPVDTNTSWNEQDVYVPTVGGLSGVSSGDDVADGGSIPLRMVITPNSGYVVEASQFTISGVEPGETNVTFQFDIGNGSNEVVYGARQWYSGSLQAQSASFMTWGYMIDSIVMYDSGTPLDPNNTVVVLAYLSPDYQVDTSNVIIGLDIDGDAVEYNVGPQTASQFYISVELNDNANAKVFSVVPTGLNNDIAETPSPWSIMVVDPDWGWDSLNQTRASVLCTFAGSQAQQENAKLLWPGDTNPNQGWFWIVPNEGYTVSRHNFSLEGGSIGGEQITGYWSGWEQVSYITWTSSSIQGPQTSTGANLSDYDEAAIIGTCTTYLESLNYTNVDENNLCEGAYPFVGWDSVTFQINTSTIQAQFEGEVEDVSAANLYGGENGTYGSSTSLYNSTSQVLFVDTAAYVDTSAGEVFDDIDYPYSLYNDTFNNGSLPDNLCPSDWNGNAVLIVLNGIKDHTPGAYPKNIRLKIDGSAMLDDGSVCENVEVDIIPDCLDGLDEFGNPC